MLPFSGVLRRVNVKRRTTDSIPGAFTLGRWAWPVIGFVLAYTVLIPDQAPHPGPGISTRTGHPHPAPAPSRSSVIMTGLVVTDDWRGARHRSAGRRDR
jgi:hypothetical protein